MTGWSVVDLDPSLRWRDIHLSPWLILAAFLGSAACMGGLIALGGPKALLVCICFLFCVFVLLDFRIGVVLLIVCLPISASSLFPHSMAGITGLNPLNLLLVASLGGYAVLRRPPSDTRPFMPRPLLWIYVLPIIAAGVMGSQHLGHIPAELFDQLLTFDSVPTYLRDVLIRPLLTVLIALLIGAAAANSKRPERLLLAVLVAAWVMCLVAIGYVLISGVSMEELSSSDSRKFFLPLGLHANDLGRIYGFAYALMLFAYPEVRSRSLRAWLMLSMALVVVALVLTFSRGAFFGFIVANVLFMISRRNGVALLIGAGLLMVAIAVMPGVVLDRMSTGWGEGLDAISAGRVGHIWLPLLPELWRSPIIGNGLDSIVWSDAMRMGTILTVAHPHNAYLQALMDMGVVGLVLLLAYFVHVWRGFDRLSRDGEVAPVLRGFFAGAKAGLVSLLLAAVVGGSLLPGVEQNFLWIAIGMMYGLQRRAEA